MQPPPETNQVSAAPPPAAPPPAAPPNPAPEQPAGGRPASAPGAYVGAALLIAIGLMALAVNLSGGAIGGESIPFGIGAAFLVAYAITRQYGFLVPAGILMGFGGGIVAASLAGALDNGTYVVLGGGLGFLLIYALDLLVSRNGARWWPVIPGGILLVVAGAMAMQNEGLIRDLGQWSPLVLVLIGIWLLLARARPVRH